MLYLSIWYGHRDPERRCSVTAAKSPPRRTRSRRARRVPWGPASDSWCSSPGCTSRLHHSQTFPCMSWRPQALGLYEPTAAGRLSGSPPTGLSFVVNAPRQFACLTVSSSPKE